MKSLLKSGYPPSPKASAVKKPDTTYYSLLVNNLAVISTIAEHVSRC